MVFCHTMPYHENTLFLQTVNLQLTYEPLIARIVNAWFIYVSMVKSGLCKRQSWKLRRGRIQEYLKGEGSKFIWRIHPIILEKVWNLILFSANIQRRSPGRALDQIPPPTFYVKGMKTWKAILSIKFFLL